MAHVVFALIFITCLGAISVFFGIREGNGDQEQGERTARLSPRFWQWLHWAMAGLIAFAGCFIIVMKLWDASGLLVIGWLDDYSVLIGEIIVAFAFGVSWLTKGTALELGLLQEKRASNVVPSIDADFLPQDAD